ncbi:MAG: glycosyltransferase family 2 protein [Candidatus Gastranaerophilaceae bacterium]
MLLSFIVTSYNYSNYIQECIDSIKNQSFKDFEIIVVDDASTDNSYEILKNIANIKLLKNNKNEGQLASIIRGLSVAKGDYISIIDSDDKIHSNYAKTMIDSLQGNNVAFVCCNAKNNEILTPKTHPFGGWWWTPMSCGMFKKDFLNLFLSYKNATLWKICPDKLLFNIAHLQGNSLLITDKLVEKREHSCNAGKTHFRFFINIKNNIIIRNEALKIVKNNILRDIIIKSYLYIFKQIINKICTNNKNVTK